MGIAKAIDQALPVNPPSIAASTPASTSTQSRLDRPPLPHQPTIAVPVLPPTISLTSTRRHPTRQAASGAHYNLSAKWSSFTAYLVESGASSSSSDAEATDGHTAKRKKRRLRGSDLLSEDASGSDEYQNDSEAGKKMPGRRVGTKGGDEREKQRRKKRRAGRLGRADLEVIHGEKPAVRGGGGRKARKVHGEKLDGLTRMEAGRLVEYLLRRTDWVDAAHHVHGNASVKSEAVKAEPMEEQPKKLSDQGAQVTRKKSMGPDQLKTHWKETLSKRLLDLYID
ncbi:hypothetical protein MMC34_001929 [Xylographa carneopallida]|nr:hypothetical protein [Xylographa carneopallida]